MSTELPILYSLGATPFTAIGEALKDDYRFVMTNTAVGNLLRDMGAQIAVLEDAFDLDVLYEAQGLALWLQHKVGDSLLSGTLASLNMEYPEMHSPQIAQWFPNATYESLIYAIGRIIALERIVGEHGIDGVLTHEDVSMDGRILAQLGRHHEVKVVHLPHANYFISPTDGDIHASVRADALGVYGKYMKNWFIRAGVDPDIITIVGAAHWDKMYEDSKRVSKEHARRCLGVDPEGMVFTYASSWAQDTNAWGRGEDDLLDSMRWVLDTALSMNAEVILKLHPNQPKVSAEKYAEVAQESGLPIKITSHYNAHTLKAADVVITQGSSNLAVEAGIMGVPVVEMFQSGTRYPASYDIPGTWGDTLPEQIERAIDEGVKHEFLSDMSMGPGSTERVRAYVKEQFA